MNESELVSPLHHHAAQCGGYLSVSQCNLASIKGCLAANNKLACSASPELVLIKVQLHSLDMFVHLLFDPCSLGHVALTFIRCLKLFAARRALPWKLVSDNGKVFKTLNQIVKQPEFTKNGHSLQPCIAI